MSVALQVVTRCIALPCKNHWKVRKGKVDHSRQGSWFESAGFVTREYWIVKSTHTQSIHKTLSIKNKTCKHKIIYTSSFFVFTEFLSDCVRRRYTTLKNTFIYTHKIQLPNISDFRCSYFLPTDTCSMFPSFPKFGRSYLKNSTCSSLCKRRLTLETG